MHLDGSQRHVQSRKFQKLEATGFAVPTDYHYMIGKKLNLMCSHHGKRCACKLFLQEQLQAFHKILWLWLACSLRVLSFSAKHGQELRNIGFCMLTRLSGGLRWQRTWSGSWTLDFTYSGKAVNKRINNRRFVSIWYPRPFPNLSHSNVAKANLLCSLVLQVLFVPVSGLWSLKIAWGMLTPGL